MNVKVISRAEGQRTFRDADWDFTERGDLIILWPNGTSWKVYQRDAWESVEEVE